MGRMPASIQRSFLAVGQFKCDQRVSELSRVEFPIQDELRCFGFFGQLILLSSRKLKLVGAQVIQS